MSSLIMFTLYDSSNFVSTQLKDIKSFKDLLLEKIEKNYIILDKFGHEYQKDNLSKIQINKSEKNYEFIALNTTDFSSDSVYENLELNSFKDKVLNQLRIDEILNEYLKSKKNILEKPFEICQEIGQKCSEIKENEGEELKNFENNFSDCSKNNVDFKKYIEMIKQSNNQINELSPNYKDSMELIEQMYNQAINEIEKIFANNFEGKPHYDTKDIKELRNIFTNYNSFIREKIAKIMNIQELTHNLETKINELLIYAEKINFYMNLSEIPKIFNNCKPQLEEELKRRSFFNYYYKQIIDFIDCNLISKEFEKRKKFFEINCKLSEKSKMEKKSVEILNKLFDIEQERIDEELKHKLNENENNNNDDDNEKEKIEFDENLLKHLNLFQNYLEELSESLYSKNKEKRNKSNNNSGINMPINISNEKMKNEINNNFNIEIEEIKNNLRSFSVPELNQKKILNIIENKIFKSLPNLNNSNNNNNTKNNNISINTINDIPSEFFFSDANLHFNKNEGNNSIDPKKIAEIFTERCSRFLWFYNRVYDYLSAYITKFGNFSIELIKEEPCTVNNCLVDILNENIKLKKKINEIKGVMKENKYLENLI